MFTTYVVVGSENELLGDLEIIYTCGDSQPPTEERYQVSRNTVT